MFTQVRGEVIYERRARQDILFIGDASVAAEIYWICGYEIQVLAQESPIDGYIAGSRDRDMWRRAVRRSALDQFTRFDLDDDVDEFRSQACDYVIVYRFMTQDDAIRLRRSEPALLVARTHVVIAALTGAYDNTRSPAAVTSV